MRDDRKTAILVATLLVIVPAVIIARIAGPPPGRTGAPGDLTCATAECHAGTVNPGEGFIKFDGLFDTYTPGIPLDFEFELEQVSAAVHGFQATARPFAGVRWEVRQVNTQVICSDESVRGNGNCPAEAPIEYIEHNSPQADNNFDVRLIPPDTDVGPITIYVAMNGANDNLEPTGDQIYTQQKTLTFRAATALPSIREVQPVLQAFDNSDRLSPGTYIQIFGDNLSPTTRQWAAFEFSPTLQPGLNPGAVAPTVLDGVLVMVNNVPAAVSFISPKQVNAVALDGIGEGVMNVKVTNESGQSNEVAVTATNVSPAMQSNPNFVSGETAYVVATLALEPGTFVGPEGLVPGFSFRPAKPGDIVTVFVVGAGSDAAYPAGRIPETAAPLAVPFEVRIGDAVAQAVAVANPQFVGLFQFNITIPNLGPGDYRITLTVDGVDTGQVLFISVAAP